MSVYQKASLVQIPSGYKASAAKLYSVVPSSGDGDFTVSANANATRVNKDGVIESVAANQARLNYDFDNPQDPHLLLEPTRTQLAHYTNAISSTNGYSLINGTLTTNSHTAPDGTSEASTFKVTSSLGQFQKVKTGSSGVQYTVSAYVKRKTGTGTVYLRAVENTNTAVTVTDEWTRVSLTVTSTSTNIRYGMALATSGDEIYVWGFQVEAGSYATSLIPNSTGTDITRTRDTVKIEPYSALPSDYPLTVFWEGSIDDYSAGQFIFSIFTSGSNAKYLGFAWNSTSYFYLYRRSSTNNDADLISFSSSKNTNYKVAVVFSSNTQAKVYINGSEVYNLTSGLDVDYEFNSVLIGQQRVVSDGGQRNSAKQFMIFNEELTDTELQTLTS